MFSGKHASRELVDLYEERIKKYNSASAMTSLADILLDGMIGVPRDPDRALQLLQRAIALNYLDASFQLALLYTSGAPTIRRDYRRAADILESVIASYRPWSSNTLEAICMLSALLEEGGHGLPRDRSRAYQLLERALNDCRHYTYIGNTQVLATHRIAKMLTSALDGFPYDVQRGIRLYKQAVSYGATPSVRYELALLYLNGRPGFAPDLHRAVKSYKRACSIRSWSKAKLMMAYDLLHGTSDIPANPAKAVQLYEFAIDTDNSIEAMLKLASILQDDDVGLIDVPRAVRLLELAIEEGNNHEAMFELGYILRYGADSVPRDEVRAVELYKRSITQGNNLSAMYYLGMTFEHGVGSIECDKAKAIELYEQAIEAGSHVLSMQKLAFLLENDENSTAEDMNRVFGLYEQAIQERDDCLTFWGFACLLERGASGVPPDKKRSDELFERALDANTVSLSLMIWCVCNSSGTACRPSNKDRLIALCRRFLSVCEKSDDLFRIGLALEWRSSELGVSKTLAVEFLEKAIEKEDTKAMVYLASTLCDSDEIERDVDRAVRLYERAIEKDGSSDALTELGSLLAEGTLVPCDGVRAEKLFKRAIKAGSTQAVYELAYQYYLGEGIPMNTKKAVALLEECLELDRAECDALCLYADILWVGGEGVDADRDRAVQLYEKAIEVGQYPTAMKKLGVILERGYKGVPSDVERAFDLLERSIKGYLSVDAMLKLTGMYARYGRGVKRAVELCEQGIAEKSSMACKTLLAEVLLSGALDVPGDKARAIEYFEEAVEKDFCEGKGLYARLLYTGTKDIEQDVDRAMELVKQHVSCKKCGTQERDIVQLANMNRFAAGRTARDLGEAERLCGDLVEKSNAIAMLCMPMIAIDKGEESRALKILEGYNEEYDFPRAMVMLASILWSATEQNESDERRALAVQLCEDAAAWKPDLDRSAGVRAMLGTVLRLRGFKCEDEYKRAVEVCEESVWDGLDELGKVALANVLSEGFEGQRDLARARQLYDEVARGLRADSVGCKLEFWVRRGCVVFDQEFWGEEVRLRNVGHDVRLIAKLNIVSMLLESSGTGSEEAVGILEEEVEKGCFAAMLVLAFVLRNSVGGVCKDVGRAYELRRRAQLRAKSAPPCAWNAVIVV